MDDPQLSGGDGLSTWLYIWATAASVLGGVLYQLGAGFLRLRGWFRAKDEAKEDALVERVHAKVAVRLDSDHARLSERIEAGMSEIRQHVAAIHKGIEGKQALQESRLGEFYKEMRDRDERLSEVVHKRMSGELRELRRHIDEKVDDLRQHLSDVVHLALNGRPKP